MAAATTPGFDVVKRQARVSAVPATDPTTDQDAEQTERERVEDLLRKARDRFRDAPNASGNQRREMLEDLKFRGRRVSACSHCELLLYFPKFGPLDPPFYCGQQWDQAIFAHRDQQGHPCLTIQRALEFCL